MTSFNPGFFLKTKKRENAIQLELKDSTRRSFRHYNILHFSHPPPPPPYWEADTDDNKDSGRELLDLTAYSLHMNSSQIYRLYAGEMYIMCYM